MDRLSGSFLDVEAEAVEAAEAVEQSSIEPPRPLNRAPAAAHAPNTPNTPNTPTPPPAAPARADARKRGRDPEAARAAKIRRAVQVTAAAAALQADPLTKLGET